MNGQQITNEEYHSLPSISATGLKTFLKSPAHYKAAKENNEDTPAFRAGSDDTQWCIRAGNV
jgi:hypothetical protein